ncbi:HAMP domain-containing histidine kinase [Thauera aromatica]|uniref:sensor histidine kinase n=1 Tax=Thauera aromatica TaxID=59405 RepID=UPI001FFCBCDD|nr:HAMP domain-containing sensor histidine kinase [Thauera aromatica]MCK2088247.1 HAMP domain-containing histidine kinase [Thauera aromatica]
MSMASATSSSPAESAAHRSGRRWLSGGMRIRIAVSVTAMLVVLIVAQSLALVGLYEEMEEEFIDGTLDEQLQYSIEHSRQLGILIGPQTPDMTLYRFTPGAELPQGLSPELAGLPLGNHEDWSSGRELHVAVRGADGQRYVLVYDESEHRARESAVITAVVIGDLMLVALSFILVYAIAGRMTRGLETLAERVEGERDGTPFAEESLDAELLAVARALDRAEARQAAVLARERDFSANLSHELRTPLAGIRSDAEMLLTDSSLSDKARRRAERIIATTDRTTTLAHSLLLLAREARPQVVEPVNLGAAVRSAWSRLHPAGAEALTIRIDPQAEVATDPNLLALVLHNLLENALRHGEGHAIEVVQEGRRLEVLDRGAGFGTEDPMRCFERFRRGGSKPGHGLGLALVRHICTACGWTVHAANRPDGGACLTIDFGAGPA